VAAHHRFNIQVVCPCCGATSAFQVVEDAEPPFTDTPRRAYISDEEKFILLPETDPPEIECQACSAVFPGAPR
jgi:hypothetical protein